MVHGGGLLSTATREQIAVDLLREAERPAFTAPRVLGIRLGFRLCLGAEETTSSVLAYPWCADARELGGAQHRALVRGYLLRRRLAHDAVDVEELAVDVALPPEERPRGYAHLLWSQRWLPAAVIHAVSASLRLRA